MGNYQNLSINSLITTIKCRFRERVKFRENLLFMLYISQTWIPLRRQLIKDHQVRRWQIQRKKRAGGRPPEFIETNVDKLLPPLHPMIKLYFALSTGIHIMNIIISAIFIFNSSLREERGGYLKVIRCHTHRLILHNFLGQEWVMWMGGALSGLHLTWRFLMLVFEREMTLDTLLFLLPDRKELHKLSDPQLALAIFGRYSSLDSIRRVLYYKIDDRRENSLEFRLKPGRSKKDRLILENMIESGIRTAILATLLALAVAAPLGLYAFLTELDFYYPNCYTQGYDLVFLNRLFGSLNLSLIFLFDSFFAIFLPPTISLIMFYDLMVYWSHVESKLDTMAKILQTHNNDWSSEIHTDQPVSTYSLLFKYEQALAGQANFMQEANVRRYEQLDRRILELQSLAVDFFSQLERADQYTSVMLGFVFGIWLAFHGIITFAGIRDFNRTTAIVTACAQLVLLSVLVVLSFLILTLKRRTEPAYRVLCSIMANDPSMDKRRWAVLLKYYTVRPRYAFTIVHAKIFSLGLFIKTFSYTFTFSLFVGNVRSSRFQ